MRYLRMLPSLCTRPRRIEPLEGRSSGWVRAPQSGILRTLTPLGARVEAHQCLGVVADPFGEREAEVHTPTTGIVIGRINLPLVNEGEALFHIARVGPGAGGRRRGSDDAHPRPRRGACHGDPGGAAGLTPSS